MAIDTQGIPVVVTTPNLTPTTTAGKPTSPTEGSLSTVTEGAETGTTSVSVS